MVHPVIAFSEQKMWAYLYFPYSNANQLARKVAICPQAYCNTVSASGDIAMRARSIIREQSSLLLRKTGLRSAANRSHRCGPGAAAFPATADARRGARSAGLCRDSSRAEEKQARNPASTQAGVYLNSRYSSGPKRSVEHTSFAQSGQGDLFVLNVVTRDTISFALGFSTSAGNAAIKHH